MVTARFPKIALSWHGKQSMTMRIALASVSSERLALACHCFRRWTSVRSHVQATDRPIFAANQRQPHFSGRGLEASKEQLPLGEGRGSRVDSPRR